MLHLGQFIEGVTVFVVVVEWDTYLHTVLWWFSLFLAIILLLSSMSLQKVSECRNVVTTSTHKRHHIPPPRPDDDEHAFTRRVQVHRPLHSLSFVYFSLPLLGRRINHRILLLKNLNNLILLSRTHTQPQTQTQSEARGIILARASLYNSLSAAAAVAGIDVDYFCYLMLILIRACYILCF